MNLLNITCHVLDFIEGSQVAEIYQNSHFKFKTLIKPFHNEMLNNVNNIILFVDNDYNITGGQIGKYDIENGLRVVMF
jgi:hypothetical protein